MNNIRNNLPKEVSMHDKLVRTIRTAIIEKENLTKSEKEKVASTLGDILCLGKESVYRRLRGDVRFSFEEVVLISQSLGFSVDNIIGSQVDERAIFELNVIDSHQINTDYMNKIEGCSALLRKSILMGNSTLKCAFNSLPFIFYLHYDNLAKFRLFKWAYQVMKMQSLPYKDFQIEKQVSLAQRAFISEIRKINESHIIINQDMFSSIFRDVNYFHTLNMLDSEDLKLIKAELNELLSEIECISISGLYKNSDSNVALYLCNVDIDASYLLLENNNFIHSHFVLYGINGISSSDPNVCKMHTQWIDSLKRYSTLITYGGEIQRYKFFQEQRRLINAAFT